MLRYNIQFTAAHWASKEKNRGINQLGRISSDQFKYNAIKHQEEAWLHTVGSNHTLKAKRMLHNSCVRLKYVNSCFQIWHVQQVLKIWACCNIRYSLKDLYSAAYSVLTLVNKISGTAVRKQPNYSSFEDKNQAKLSQMNAKVKNQLSASQLCKEISFVCSV